MFEKGRIRPWSGEMDNSEAGERPGLSLMVWALLAVFFGLFAADDRSGRTGMAMGFGAGGIAPIVFGVVLDLTNPPGTAPETWGWAFMVLGIGGLAATICAAYYREVRKIR